MDSRGELSGKGARPWQAAVAIAKASAMDVLGTGKAAARFRHGCFGPKLRGLRRLRWHRWVKNHKWIPEDTRGSKRHVEDKDESRLKWLDSVESKRLNIAEKMGFH